MLACIFSANIFNIPVDHPDNYVPFSRVFASIILLFSLTSPFHHHNSAFYQRVLLSRPLSFRLPSFLSSCYAHSFNNKSTSNIAFERTATAVLFRPVTFQATIYPFLPLTQRPLNSGVGRTFKKRAYPIHL